MVITPNSLTNTLTCPQWKTPKHHQNNLKSTNPPTLNTNKLLTRSNQTVLTNWIPISKAQNRSINKNRFMNSLTRWSRWITNKCMKCRRLKNNMKMLNNQNKRKESKKNTKMVQFTMVKKRMDLDTATASSPTQMAESMRENGNSEQWTATESSTTQAASWPTKENGKETLSMATERCTMRNQATSRMSLTLRTLMNLKTTGIDSKESFRRTLRRVWEHFSLLMARSILASSSKIW